MEPRSYQAGWDALRMAYRRLWIAALWIVPVGALAVLLPEAWGGLRVAAFGAWIIGFLMAYWQLRLFRCPRCHQLFFFNMEIGNSNIDMFIIYRCQHCRLEKWSEPLPE